VDSKSLAEPSLFGVHAGVKLTGADVELRAGFSQINLAEAETELEPTIGTSRPRTTAMTVVDIVLKLLRVIPMRDSGSSCEEDAKLLSERPFVLWMSMTPI
jgi:hypothetical protein